MPTDTITVPNSVFIDGKWFDAHWLAEIVDDDTGELLITATITAPGQLHVTALRMTMDLVRDLRIMAGFSPATPADQARADLAYWRESVQWCVDTLMDLGRNNGNARLALENGDEYLRQLLVGRPASEDQRPVTQAQIRQLEERLAVLEATNEA